MAIVNSQPSYTYDDLMLVPRYSDIKSRFSTNEVDLSTWITPAIKIKYPIISANMDTITGKEMLLAMNKLGGIGIHHRQCDTLVQWEALNSLPLEAPKIACIGVGEKEFGRLQLLMSKGAHITAVCIDVAHGHSQQTVEQIHRIKAEYSDLSIIAGNIATAAGARTLIREGVDSLKAGVGCGALCTTRLATGNGVPQLSAIMDIARERDLHYWEKRVSIIADGGIRYPGDCCKALAAGADAVMIGSLFAGADETPGEFIASEEEMKKCYRGSASFSAQKEWKGEAKSVEGEEVNVLAIGPVKEVFTRLVHGILSGMSYQGAHNLKELQDNAVFQVQTYAGIIEAMPHRKLTKT